MSGGGVCNEGVSLDVKEGRPKTSYVLSLDVGTTTLRAYIYDSTANIVGTGTEKIEVVHPKPGWSEMDPDLLWRQVKAVIHNAISDAYLSAKDITCMGITTQRNTFITWDKDTGVPFHPFVTWQDLRSSAMVKSWNDSITMKGFNAVSKLIYWVTRIKRFLAASVLRYKSAQVIFRLKYQIEHIPQLKKRISEKKVNFGNLDTWLLWKMTGEKVFATDYSCASSTGLYDPFQMEWSPIVSGLTGLPLHILPPLKDTSGLFGKCEASIFGAEIPITAIVADQQGAMFGQCCFDLGDVKCTMGTGTFIDCNTGSKPHASIAGLYPLIGWKIGKEIVFLAEGHSADTGVCMEWAKDLGLFDDVSQTSAMAESVQHSDGVYFIPAFSGLQAPVNDDKACTALIGIKPGTSKACTVRAILESLAFRGRLLHDTILKETRTQLSKVISCDGGVSNNNFLMQLVADLTQCQLDRAKHMDMTSLGAAFLAGLAVGVWHNKEEFKTLRRTDRLFQPRVDVALKYQDVYKEWQRAMKRTKDWYQHVDT